MDLVKQFCCGNLADDDDDDLYAGRAKGTKQTAIQYDPIAQLKMELRRVDERELRKRCERIGISQDEVDERTDRVKDPTQELVKLLIEFELRQQILNEHFVICKRADGTNISIDPPAGLTGTLIDEEELHELHQIKQSLEQDLFDLEFEMENLNKLRPPDTDTIKLGNWQKLYDDLEEQINELETILREEHGRVNKQEAEMLANAPKLETTRKGNSGKTKKGGKKPVMAAEIMDAGSDKLSRVTIDDEELPLGVDWHFQGGRAVVGSVREGGAASMYQGGKMFKQGMILKEYYLPDNGRLFRIDYGKMKAKVIASGGKGSTHNLSKFLSQQLDHIGRPLQLVFEEPGHDLLLEEKKRMTGNDFTTDEKKHGVAIQDLKYVIPKMQGDLGIKWWKTRHGVCIVDIMEGGIVARPHYMAEGLRPGMVIKELHSGDGLVRDFSGGDRSYHQIVQVISMALRPMVLVFKPEPEVIEFTFEIPVPPLEGFGLSSLNVVSMATTAVSTSVKAANKGLSVVPGAVPLGQEGASSDWAQKEWHCLEALGMSLTEEDSSMWDGHNWRIRVENVRAGGLIDDFNGLHEHDWVCPGMLLVSVHSPMKKLVSLSGKSLPEVIKLLHEAAPGIDAERRAMQNGRPITERFNGKTLTLGFAYAVRAGRNG
jgi:hypothetical protein